MGNKSFEKVEQFEYLGPTLTNQNFIQEEIKNRLKSRNNLGEEIITKHIIAPINAILQKKKIQKNQSVCIGQLTTVMVMVIGLMVIILFNKMNSMISQWEESMKRIQLVTETRKTQSIE